MIRQETLYKRLVISLLSAVVVIFFVAVGIYKKPVQWAESLVGGVIYSVQEGLAVRLQGLLNFKDASPLKLIAANVIGREMGPWFQTFMINKGSSEGVLVDMGVIVPDGVVGKVIKSLPHNAQVLLMTDTNSAIAAMVQRTREGGIVQGMGENGARLKYLPRVSEVLEGDIMITSGLEGSFAKGVPIGQIKKIERPEDGFFLNITLTPAIAFSKLEEVLVLSFQENPQ
ncbi:MAG: rod shape-determining protein MreC [Nitrospirae bacterium]|nr:rod shape-determining protein MreC [Candidatus Troglogloeales bacterium]